MHTIQYGIGKKLLLMVKRHAWLFKILNTGRQLVNLLRTYLNKKKKVYANCRLPAGSVLQLQINLLINIEIKYAREVNEKRSSSCTGIPIILGQYDKQRGTKSCWL